MRDIQIIGTDSQNYLLSGNDLPAILLRCDSKNLAMLHYAAIAVNFAIEEVHLWSANEPCDEYICRFAVHLVRGPNLLFLPE